MLSCIHALHPECPTCTSRSFCCFTKLEIRGGAVPCLRRSLELAFSNLSPAGDRVPLGSGGALREGLKTTGGGRLAGGASV